MRKKYCEMGGDEGPNTIVYIEEEVISLSLAKDIDVSKVKRDGWELTLLVRPPTVSYKAVVYCVLVNKYCQYFFSCGKVF